MNKLAIDLQKYVFIPLLLMLLISCAGKRFFRIEDTWNYWYYDKENNLVFYTNITQPAKRFQPARVKLRILNKNDYDLEVAYLLKIYSNKKKEEFIETEDVKETVPKSVQDKDGYADFEIEVDGINHVSDIEFSRFSATRLEAR